MKTTSWLLYGLCFCSVLFGVLGLLEAGSVRRRWRTLKLTIQPLVQNEGRARRSTLRRLLNGLQKTAYMRNTETRLREANLPLTPLQWILLALGSWSLFSLLLAKLFVLDVPYNGLLAYLLWQLISYQWRKSRTHKLSQAISKQLTDVCRLLASAAKAGLSVQQGLELVAAELKPPAGRLFQEVVSELKVGNSLDIVLGRLRKQVKSKELTLFTNALLIHRRVGVNLVQMLDDLALTLEERQRVRKEIANFSAEPRFIALLLTGMPVLIILLFNVALDGFAQLLFTPPGMVLLVLSATLIAAGLVMIRKIANIKV